MNSSDYKKLLAFTIAHINNEVNKTKLLVDGEMRAFSEKLSNETLLELKKSILEDALAQVPLKSLPDDIVYESQLKENSFFIETEIKRVKQTSEDKLRDATETLSESILGLDNYLRRVHGSLDEHHHDEQYAKLGHEHDYVANDRYAADRSSYLAFLDNNKEILDSIRRNASESIKSLHEKIADLDKACVNNKRDVDKSIEALREELKATETALRKSSENAVGGLSQYFDNKLGDHSSLHKQALETHRADLQKRISTAATELSQRKADKEHEHDYAHTNHEHYDLVKKIDFNAVSDEMRTLDAKNAEIINRLQAISDNLSNKLDAGKALTKSDLNETIDYIKSQVLKSIPTPKDGKDAHEWIFSFHPTKRGFLLYRRDDWHTWKGQNLIPTSTNEPQYYAAGGGGFGAASSSGGGGAPFKMSLEGFSVVIPNSVHKRDVYPVVRVFTSDGEEVSTVVKINTSNDITVESNINLTEHFVVIN